MKLAHDFFADFFVGDLAALEDDADLHFIAVFEELAGFDALWSQRRVDR
jgi:hypothetical protein